MRYAARPVRPFRGMGQTSPCPSVQQLMGVVDPTDPCQASNYLGVPISGAPGTQTGSAPAPANSLATFIQTNQTTILMVLGIAAVAMLLLPKPR